MQIANGQINWIWDNKLIKVKTKFFTAYEAKQVVVVAALLATHHDKRTMLQG